MALGSQEILIIAVVVLLVFGAGAIPKLARSLGQAKGEFQKAQQDFKKEMDAGEADATSEAQVRETARGLGIEEADMSIEDVKKAINEKIA